MENLSYDALDGFTRAYIECALWSETDNSTPQGGEPLDKNYGPEDIAPESLRKVSDDCAKFQKVNAELLAKAYAHPCSCGFDSSPTYSAHEHARTCAKRAASYDDEYAGHDFWLTRNGHGVGFWDRGLGAVGDALAKACESFGECHIIVGDDGQLYMEGGR